MPICFTKQSPTKPIFYILKNNVIAEKCTKLYINVSLFTLRIIFKSYLHYKTVTSQNVSS